ncbi:hypothetical protein Tco_0223243 [Tanacetum coccineum]
MSLVRTSGSIWRLQDKILLMQYLGEWCVRDEDQFLLSAGEQVTNFDDDVDDPPEKDLALNVDHIFEADQCDAFESDVDEAPNIQRPLSMSALYNGHEIVKTNHAPPVVHDSEDTREIAEITRKRMLEKMKSPLCVENKVKIAPLDYSKENLLATFAPQRDLTPE